LLYTLPPNAIPLSMKPLVSKNLIVKSKYKKQRNVIQSGFVLGENVHSNAFAS